MLTAPSLTPPSYFLFPPSGPAIFQFQEADQLTGFGFAAFIIGLIGAIEAYGITKTWETPAETADRDSTFRAVAEMKEDFINGDLGFDPLGLKPKTPEAFKSIQTKEINNGTYFIPLHCLKLSPLATC